MGATVSISRRHCGPPDSGNGGFVCGVAATALGGSDVEVMLLAPPPLEHPLVLDREGEETRLLASAGFGPPAVD